MAKKAVIIGIITALLIPTAFAVASPVSTVEKEIAQLTNDVDRRRQEIGRLDGRLETTTKEIIKTYQKLDSQENSLKVQQQALNARIGEVYKNYDELFIGIFLDVHSFADVWKHLSFLTKLNQADTVLLATNKYRLDQVRQLKQQLAQKKREQIDLRKRKQIEYLRLQNSLLQKKALLEAKLRGIKADQATTTTVAP